MPARVTVGADRVVYADGKPFFLVGARHMPVGGTPAILADAGFNAYRTLAFGSESADPDPLPDPADGICFWSYVFDRTCLGRSPGYRSELEELVARVKDHPAFLCYENFNEPAKVSMWQEGKKKPKAMPEDLSAGTALLRSLDPHHPLWLAHNFQRTAETLASYNQCADIVGSNCYPVMPQGGIRRYLTVRNDGRMIDCPDQTIHAVARYTEKMMKVSAGRMPIWMLIQGMANASWLNPENTPIPAERTIDESKIRYPTYQELRFMAFDAIIAGATGLAMSLHKTAVGSDAWDAVKRVARELRGLGQALTALVYEGPVTVTYEDLGFTIWDGVKVLAREDEQSVWLFAANTAFDPAQVTMRLSNVPSNCTAVVESEGREAAVENGLLTDAFGPYAVHVYRIPAQG